LLLLAAACQRSPKTDDGTSVASPPSSRSSAPSAVASAAWFVGAWQGAFQAELFRVEVPFGAAKEWKTDDGKEASGEGKLSLHVAADGSVTGATSGALGELSVVGHVEGDRATLTLVSARSDGFHGVVLASQTPEGMSGTISASSGDSLRVRQAKVTLTRAAP
jgi:hypothetical protein